MVKLLRQTCITFVLLTVITGVLYPLAITAVAKVFFSHQAEGSLVDGAGLPAGDPAKAIGSSLIGQNFDAPQYFWPRPSATAVTGGSDGLPYNAAQSTGSNLGPTNPALLDAVKSRVDALQKADPGNQSPIPVDLVTASASGLDPEESPAAARYQATRIAAARKVPVEQIVALIDARTTHPLLGESTVNVLALNLALDSTFKPVAGPASTTNP